MAIPSIVRVFLIILLAVMSGAASAADYSGYRVTETQMLDLVAGPANTAALLSPDGRQLLHIGTSQICLLTQAQAWSRTRCIDNNPRLGLRAPEDALWSPRGDHVAMPTYVEGLLMFSDTDIRVLDPQTMTVTNLTDDGNDGGLLKNPKPGNFDAIARWLDNDTLVFLRYPISPDIAIGPPSLMTIKVTGGAPSAIVTLPDTESITIYVIAVSADGRIAYSLDDRKAPAVSGIHILEAGSTTPRRIAAMSDIGQPPVGMAFSADGKFLLLLGLNETKMGLDARVLDLAGGKSMPVDTRRNVTGVAWSPAGAALAYVTIDHEQPDEPGGLFLVNQPGEAGRELLKGSFMAPVCCGNLPFTWASNDTMILGNAAKHDAPLLIRLGE